MVSYVVHKSERCLYIGLLLSGEIMWYFRPAGQDRNESLRVLSRIGIQLVRLGFCELLDRYPHFSRVV
jgi:hypothetical protein